MVQPQFADAPLQVSRTTRRKTITIQVADGAVRVLAPRWVAAGEIYAFVEDKRRWIEDKLAEQARRPSVAPRRYVSGETFLWLGRPLTLDVAVGRRGLPTLAAGRLTVPVRARGRRPPDPHAVRRRLEWWYRDHGCAHLTGRTEISAARLGRQPASVALRSYKSRWGSCSVDGEITYDWRVVMAPPEVVDYIVAHEVAHLRHLDHSPQFWRCVAMLCPGYKIYRAWLRDHGHVMQLPEPAADTAPSPTAEPQ